MFEKVSQAAERVAKGVSRREIFGKLSRGALAAAGVLGAILAAPGQAQAAGKHCCLFTSEPIGGGYFCAPRNGGKCPRGISGGIVGLGAVKCTDPRCA